jgi:hypothetical protein
MMVGWAVEGGADLIIGETFCYAGEALAARPGYPRCPIRPRAVAPALPLVEDIAVEVDRGEAAGSSVASIEARTSVVPTESTALLWNCTPLIQGWVAPLSSAGKPSRSM